MIERANTFCTHHFPNRLPGPISMNGRGRYLDNIFVERLWRSLNQEAIYLEEIDDGCKARCIIRGWMAFYNTKRPHSALGRQTPDDVYWAGLEQRHAA
ncbi:Integrase core domain-containing protein [Aliiroseovarius sediminilitoris]|uniref:Integrase core domain-containing protein n=2 Tax=Aliiroseovarius sediminilitoris TaxID=1173584 RepID=A0A1I0MLA8_9RHOB|nr:Integrase core domain-containing protein [Aliiroseovarius sediminilitoris]